MIKREREERGERGRRENGRENERERTREGGERRARVERILEHEVWSVRPAIADAEEDVAAELEAAARRLVPPRPRQRQRLRERGRRRHGVWQEVTARERPRARHVPLRAGGGGTVPASFGREIQLPKLCVRL